MRHRHDDARPGRKNDTRTGTILVITAIMLLVLVGMVGLVVDAGQLMTSHRLAQNAADAASMAAAFDLLRGHSVATAEATATAFVQQHNGLPTATVDFYCPPVSGPHTGDSRYAEVVVSSVVSTRLIQVLGGAWSRTVSARSVAGHEAVPFSAGLISLNPAARPGISGNGNAVLRVNGTIIDNSNGGGYNEFGQPINNGNTGSALSLIGNAVLAASNLQVVGGVSVSSNAAIRSYDGSSSNPLHTGVPIQPDPFGNIPVPTTGNGAVATNYGAVSVTGNNSVTLNPGVYSSISLSANGNVTMNPGIYVIKGGGLSVTGNGDITGNNVLIYNTSSDYNVNTGLPDSNAGSTAPPTSGSNFGAVTISGNGTINITPYSNPSSPFNGLSFFQSRLNTKDFSVTGNGSISGLRGTVYAKWAALILSGNGTSHSQFAVANTVLNGNGTITIDYLNQANAMGAMVFLVE